MTEREASPSLALSGRLLVVDSDCPNREHVATILKDQGHDVALARDGQTAMAMLERESFDLVLLDIAAPAIDGFLVLEGRNAKPALREVPVIVISASDDVATITRAVAMGAEDYMFRPANPVLLAARIQSNLQRKRLRAIESVYVRQELAIRQTEKLATLGKLSAGLAHELNNPAAAVMRGAALVQQRLPGLQAWSRKLGQIDMSAEQIDALNRLDEMMRRRVEQPLMLEALDRSDREAAIESWLDDHGVMDGWQIAPALVELDLTDDEWREIAGCFGVEVLPVVVVWLDHSLAVYSLASEIGEGAERMAQIVHALKSYSYMDQAPLKDVDIIKGIETTLVILRNKLKQGIEVQRMYAENLPRVQAYGGELNQVWTNLVDNAIDAMNGQGELTLRAKHQDDWIVVEIEDTGPGIPAEDLDRIFDPFFTTKPQGSGTGLGLSIARNIVVGKHGGRLEVDSKPGKTRFIVSIPLV